MGLLLYQLSYEDCPSVYRSGVLRQDSNLQHAGLLSEVSLYYAIYHSSERTGFEPVIT